MSLGKFITGICERTGTVPVGLLCNGLAGVLMKLGETGSLAAALQQVGIGSGGTVSAILIIAGLGGLGLVNACKNRENAAKLANQIDAIAKTTATDHHKLERIWDAVQASGVTLAAQDKLDLVAAIDAAMSKRLDALPLSILQRLQAMGEAIQCDDAGIIEVLETHAKALSDQVSGVEERLTKLLEPIAVNAQTAANNTADLKAAQARTETRLALLLAYHDLTWDKVTLRPFSHTVPTHYVARQSLLNELAAKLAAAQQVGVRQAIAAHGDGGEGKTVLAIAYAQAALRGELGPDHLYPGGVVFASVGDCTLQAALASALADLPGDAKLDERQKAQLVHGKLSLPPRSLLIIDNVDDGTLWTSEAIQEWLPSDNCRVIATTRAESLGPLPMQRVGEVDLPTAVALLAKFRPDAADPANHAAIVTIHKEVAGLALALAAVGAYMQIDAESAAPGEAKSWADEAAFLKAAPLDQFHDRADGVRERAQHETKTVAAIEALRQRLTPAELLALDFAACLPENMVPTGWLEDLIAECAKYKPPRYWVSRQWTKFLAARLRQPARGLATPLGTSSSGDPHTPASIIHRLVTLDLLRLERDELAAFPDATSANRRRATLRSLHRLHAKQCVTHMQATPNRQLALLTAITDCAAGRWADIIKGNRGTGKGTITNPAVLIDHTLRWELTPLAKVCDGLWADNKPGPAARLGVWLACVLDDMGRYTEAAACLQLTQENEAAVAACIGHEHLAACYSNLALIQQVQGDLPAARANIERAIAIDSKHLVEDHLTFAIRYSVLAGIQQVQGDLPAARANIERAIAIDSKHLAEDHPTFAIRYSNLALIQRAQGDLPAARANIERAIAIDSKHFPEDHPSLASSYANLALIQRSQGEWPAARANVERAIRIGTKQFGAHHPSLATWYNNLAHICTDERKIHEAVALWRRSYAIDLQAFGPNHPATKHVAAMLRKYAPPGP
jgi:tetratricopeptide (TPR) repeat protein